MQIRALVFLCQVDAFECHADGVGDVITDLRIEPTVIAIPHAERAREIFRRAVGSEGTT